MRRLKAAGFVPGRNRGQARSHQTPAPFVVRASSCGRPLAAMRRLKAAGFVPGRNRGQARSHQTPAPFVVRASSCGSGLWPRCGIGTPRASFQAAIAGKPAPTKHRLRLWFGRVLVGAASGHDAAFARRRLRSRPQSRASPLPPNTGSVCGAGEFLWERPLAAMRHWHAAGFVPGCNRGQAPACMFCRGKRRNSLSGGGTQSGSDGKHVQTVGEMSRPHPKHRSGIHRTVTAVPSIPCKPVLW